MADRNYGFIPPYMSPPDRHSPPPYPSSYPLPHHHGDGGHHHHHSSHHHHGDHHHHHPQYPPSFPSAPHVPYPPYSPQVPFRPIHPQNDSVNRAYYWVDTFARGGIPSTALHGGVDIDGHQIYVGRAFFEGDWIPAKVIPGKNVAYVAYDGKEHAVDRFQVLCEQRFDWVPTHGDHIPPDAVEGGRTSNGEILYIGRVHHQGSHTVGKVHPSHKSCYIPFGGEELGFHDYEILVLRS